jgi:hypothetical protein
MNKPLDLDRLHKNVEIITSGGDWKRDHYWLPRAAGRTTALMHLLIGNIQVGDEGNTYLYVSTTIRESGFNMRLFAETLDCAGVTGFEYKPMTERITFPNLNITVFFKSVGALRSTRGVRISRAFLDVDSHRIGTRWEYDEYQYALAGIRAAGADIV